MAITIYAIAGLISIFFMFLSSRYDKKYDNAIQNKITIYNKKRMKMKKSTLFSFLSFSILLLLIILRANTVGTDYINYISTYLNIVNDQYSHSIMDWLGLPFLYIIKFSGYVIGDNYRLFFGIIGFITLFFIYMSINKISNNKVLSLYLFLSFCLYYQVFNQSRQMLAIAIIMFAMQYIMKRDLIKFALCIAIATCFHMSAIIMIPMYYLFNAKINKANLLKYLVITLATFLLFDFVVINILSQTIYSGYLGSGYDKEYAVYAVLNLVFRLFLLIICLCFANKVNERFDNAKYLYNAAIICTFVQFLTVRSYLFGRITTYFFVFYIFLIPLVLECISPKYKKIVTVATVLFFAIYHIYYYSIGAVSGGYDNYQFFFQ